MKSALIVKVCVPAILLVAAAIFVAHSQQQPPPTPPAPPRVLTPNDIAVQRSVHTAYVSPTTDIP